METSLLIQWYENNKNHYHTPKNKLTKEYQEILFITSFLDDFYTKPPLSQRIWHFKNDSFELYKCQICGSVTQYKNNNGGFYKKCCSDVCYKKYGKTTMMLVYESTMLERYNVSNFFKIDGFQQIRDKSCSEKYGGNYKDDFKEKAKKTNLELYGVDNYIKSKELKDLLTENKNKFREKAKKTTFERYGVDSYFKTDESKSPKIRLKIHKTKKENGSYGKSKEEDELYYDLVLLFGAHDVVRQHQDKRYYNTENNNLFACDFYIISLDWFIEYDGIWTHIPQYLPENERNEMLNVWKEKANNGSKYYKGALQTYERDCMKRKISADNKLKMTFIPRNK